jgi:hypothetical protein
MASIPRRRGVAIKTVGSSSENGIEAFRAYTRQQSLIINPAAAEFDWFGIVAGRRYS